MGAVTTEQQRRKEKLDKKIMINQKTIPIDNINIP